MKYYFPVTTAKILLLTQVGRENSEASISWMKDVIGVKVEKLRLMKS